jgi:tellurite resistance protein TehA-like permease
MSILIDTIFDACVLFLSNLAKLLRMTYNEVNVWIFCVIWPIFTIFLIVRLIQLKRKIRKLKSKISNSEKR